MTDTTAPRTAAPFDTVAWVAWWDARTVTTADPNDLMGLMVMFEQMRDAAEPAEAIEPLLALVGAAEELDSDWYVQSTGPDGVHLKYSSDFPASLNTVRAALGALPESVRVAARKP